MWRKERREAESTSITPPTHTCTYAGTSHDTVLGHNISSHSLILQWTALLVSPSVTEVLAREKHLRADERSPSWGRVMKSA